MVAFVKIDQFVEDLCFGVHDFTNTGSAALTLALTDTAHTASWAVLLDLTPVSYTNLSTRVLALGTSGQTSGTYKLLITDLVLTAGGGAVAGFRYIYIYNDSTVGPTDALCWHYDYGSTLALADGESLTVDFDGSGGVFTLA